MPAIAPEIVFLLLLLALERELSWPRAGNTGSRHNGKRLPGLLAAVVRDT